MPWPQGAVPADQTFALSGADGAAVAVQSWPLAYWPDGTLKWSAHAVGPAATADKLPADRRPPGRAAQRGRGRGPP